MYAPPWSKRLRAFSPTDIPADELEALSRRYSSATILLLPLSSGKVALFDNARVFRLIAEEGDLTHQELSRLSAEWDAELRAETQHAERLRSLGLVEPDARRMARDIRKAPQSHPDFGIEELDLESL